MTSQENMVALTTQVLQFTQSVGDLQQRLAAQQLLQQQQMFFTGKGVKIEKIGGNGFHNWSHDIRALK